MEDTHHRLTATASANGIVFECEEGCGRRVVLDRQGRLTVIDRGDPLALHRGGTEDVELAMADVRPG